MTETQNPFKTAAMLDDAAAAIRRKIRRVRNARNPEHRAEGLAEIEDEADRLEQFAVKLRGDSL